MTPEAAAWLSEMWPTCRELPVGERLAKREADRRQQREMEDRAAAQGVESGPVAVEKVAS